MAWTDTCKIEAVNQIERFKEKGMGAREAIKRLSEESDIPYDTLEKWVYPRTPVAKNGHTVKEPAEFIPIENLQSVIDAAGRIQAQAEEEIRNTEPSRPHVSKNTGENEWYTPPEYIKSVIYVMGGIDVDPASSETANKIIGAKAYFTQEQNGLDKKWTGRVFLNPPYAQPLISQFVKKLVKEYESKETNQAIVLVNNATETLWFKELADHARAVMFITGRVKFLDPQGKPGAPLQGQAFIYFGDSPQKFLSEFQKFGWGALL